MLANLVAVADSQITSSSVEILVERIRPQHRARRNLIAIAERRPTFDVDVWFEVGLRAQHDVLFDDDELADDGSRSDHGIGMHSRRGRNLRGRVDHFSWRRHSCLPRRDLSRCMWWATRLTRSFK